MYETTNARGSGRDRLMIHTIKDIHDKGNATNKIKISLNLLLDDQGDMYILPPNNDTVQIKSDKNRGGS